MLLFFCSWHTICIRHRFWLKFSPETVQTCGKGKGWCEQLLTMSGCQKCSQTLMDIAAYKLKSLDATLNFCCMFSGWECISRTFFRLTHQKEKSLSFNTFCVLTRRELFLWKTAQYNAKIQMLNILRFFFKEIGKILNSLLAYILIFRKGYKVFVHMHIYVYACVCVHVCERKGESFASHLFSKLNRISF